MRSAEHAGRASFATPSHINRPTIQARDAQLISGIQKHLSQLPDIVLTGVSYTPAEVIALFQRQIDSTNACTQARAKLRDTVLADRELAKEVSKVVSALRSFVVNLKGDQADLLAEFGFAPRKTRSTPKVEEKAAAVAKNKATREARHTLGKKQRLKITGTPETSAAASTTPAPAGVNGAAGPPAAHA